MALSSSFLSSLFLLVTCSLLIHTSSHVTKPQTYPPLVEGLSWDFYASSCPKLETTIRENLDMLLDNHAGLAAGLLRLHFHDCFVQGCEGSILLVGSESEPSEQEAPPNLTLQRAALKTINDLRDIVERQCGRVVSCADITTIAARDAVRWSGGPNYDVPLGRRDGLTFATKEETVANLPSPRLHTSGLLTSFATKDLDVNDLVALSGGHTIGDAHCGAFIKRLYPTQDPTLDETFAKNLYEVCPTPISTNSTVMDIRTPNRFDNQYHVDLLNRQGLFTSDQDLYTDKRTRDIVTSFAADQRLFFDKFIYAITKMGQVGVLTGTHGEIRANCSITNSDNLFVSRLVENEEIGLSQF